MIIKPKKMSDRREENEQLNSFKENLFGNLKDSFNCVTSTIPGLHGLVHSLLGRTMAEYNTSIPVETEKSPYEPEA